MLSHGMKQTGSISLNHLQGVIFAILNPWVAIGILLLLAFFATYIDRKSTRLNSSHLVISYDVFCLKKNAPLGARQQVAAGPNPRRAMPLLSSSSLRPTSSVYRFF